MLKRFRKAQEADILRLSALDKAGAMPAPHSGSRPSFAARLSADGPGAIIAEYKRASPSRGAINLAAEPEETAAAYAAAGASALSVLTEKEYFKGDIAFLARMAGPGLPLLRKDFLVHPLQVAETASTPASALLLIARMLENGAFAAMLAAASRFGLEAVLEVFDEQDVENTRQALERTPVSPVIIQVNNRDLQTLKVSDAPSRALVRHKQKGEIWISASGVCSRDQVEERAALGFDAVLVGGSLMEGPDPGAVLARLRGRGALS